MCWPEFARSARGRVVVMRTMNCRGDVLSLCCQDWSRGIGEHMKLEAVTVQLYRNFVDAQRIVIEPDVTCLVGKNESGKTTILKALHRLKPANSADTEFNLTTEYPRWRLAADRRKNAGLDERVPVTAEFSLSDDDRVDLQELYGVEFPSDTICLASRDYTNQHAVQLSSSLAAITTLTATAAGVESEDLSKFESLGSTAEVIAAATDLATEHRQTGAAARAKALTVFSAEIEKYEFLIKPLPPSDAQADALWAKVPAFFYFSSYDTLPGETNLTALASQIDSNSASLTSRQQAIVSLLDRAGTRPSDFLDDNYDSRKAELQAASSDLSREVFKYWKQNTDLTVILDTDNRIESDQAGQPKASRFLKIELRDGRHGDVETNFDSRSTGFQWFFSFFAAFSEYQESADPVIVLLDEPGTSLHGEAQQEFVNYIFNELGASKQTIYTTHSQHMVDPTRYEKLRAVHDQATRDEPERGVAVTLPNLSADRATILPIESALGYSVSSHLFLGSGQHLVVEGSSDFVYLQRFTEYLAANGRIGLDPRLAVIPVGGADNMPAFVALLGRRLKVSALVDGARTNKRIDRIRDAAKANGVPESVIVACSDVSAAPTNADIEDLFSIEDYLRLYNWSFGTNVQSSELDGTGEPILKKLNNYRGGFDHALPAHELAKRRDEFFASVSEQTIAKFEELFRLLNATVDPGE